MTLECVAFADVAGIIALSRDPTMAIKVGYVLLDVIGRAMFEFLAFSTVTILWLGMARDMNVTEPSLLLDSLPLIVMGTGVVLSVASICEAVDILTSTNEASWVFRGHILVEAIAWGIQAIVALICTWLTATRISRLSMLPSSNTWTQFKVVAKPLVPMVLCTVCYTIRSIWLFVLFVKLPKTSHLVNRCSMAWWIGFCWIPTFVPATMCLYSARKRDPTPDQIRQDDHLAHPLLPTPVPPAEAFISFRKFRENHDLFSPLDPRADDENLFEPPEGEVRTLDYRNTSSRQEIENGEGELKSPEE